MVKERLGEGRGSEHPGGGMREGIARGEPGHFLLLFGRGCVVGGERSDRLVVCPLLKHRRTKLGGDVTLCVLHSSAVWQ